MKIIVLILFAVISYTTANGQTTLVNCKKFHTGNFYYVDSMGRQVFVKRKKKRQAEKNSFNSLIYKSKITWVDDCTYQLKGIWTNDKTFAKASKKNTKKYSTIKIIASDESSYIYDCGCPESKNSIGKMYKTD